MIYLHFGLLDDLNENDAGWISESQCSLSLLWFCSCMIAAGYVLILTFVMWIVFNLPMEAARIARQEIILSTVKPFIAAK